MRPNQKLYVVTRRDLPPGPQAVQGMHALTEYLMYHPEKADQWYKESNHIGFLSVANEQELESLCGLLYYKEVVHEMFREPDLGMSLTAVAIEATDQASELLAKLPLALR